MAKYILLFLSAVLISSISQILLKKSAEHHYENILREYLNVKVILAYVLFFLSTLITLFSYKVLPLSMGPILEASGYVWVAILSFLILKEKIKLKKWIGLLVIILGILIYAL